MDNRVFSAIPLTDMFQIATTGRTQGHSLKLVKCRCNKDIRKYFFSHPVVSKWNMLDNDSVVAKTVNGFKTNWNGQRRWVCFWTDVCSTSRP